MKLKKIFNHMVRSFRMNPWSSTAIYSTIVIVSVVMLGSLVVRNKTRTVETPKEHSFSGGRKVAGTSQIYRKKNRKLENKINNLLSDQKLIRTKILELSKSIEKLQLTQPTNPGRTNESTGNFNTLLPPGTTQVEPEKKQTVETNVSPTNPAQPAKKSAVRTPVSRGPSVISFPTESKPTGAHRIHLSPGSFIETILLSGVQATSGKPFPVLMKATQSFIGPNKTRVDLSGCFILGKAMGNLSLGRVEIQPYKLACTARSGRLFERSLKGFVADKDDNSFGVTGEVDLKADSRLATLTFLSSLIEGIGKNIEKLQTKTTQTPNGSSSIVTGNEGRYIVAGGAASAANKMTDFFLRHAENLLPTINIHSSQKLYVVIQDSVDLPSWYFKPNKKRAQNDFAYLSRLID